MKELILYWGWRDTLYYKCTGDLSGDIKHQVIEFSINGDLNILRHEVGDNIIDEVRSYEI
jgi:hypothetical protein